MASPSQTGATLLVLSDYQARKEQGVCTYPGCDQQHAEDSSLCPAHRDAERERKRRWMRDRRKEWARAGLCTRCGKKRLPGHGWGCPACVIEVGAARTPRPDLVARHVDKTQRVAARTAVDPTGRTRYHGQDRRGRQSNQQVDEQDLDDAIERLRRGKAGLALARSPEVQQLPRIQREEAKREALSQIDHGLRFAEEVLERNGSHRENLVLTDRKVRR